MINQRSLDYRPSALHTRVAGLIRKKPISRYEYDLKTSVFTTKNPPFGIDRNPEPMRPRNFVRNTYELYERPRRPVSRYQHSPNVSVSMPPFGTSESEAIMISREQLVSGKTPILDHDEPQAYPRRLKAGRTLRNQIASSMEVPPWGISPQPKKMPSRDQLYHKKNLSSQREVNKSFELHSRPISRYQHRPQHTQIPPFGICPKKQPMPNPRDIAKSYRENPNDENQSICNSKFSGEEELADFSVNRTWRALSFGMLWWHYRDLCREKNKKRAKSLGGCGEARKLLVLLADYLVLNRCKDLLVRDLDYPGGIEFAKTWQWRNSENDGEPALIQESPYIQKMKEQN
jgi:hypothetical protein